MTTEEECSEALANPQCPYAAVIKQMDEKITQCSLDITDVKTALLGDIKDPKNKPGLIATFNARFISIEEALKRHFSVKDLGALLLGIAAFITALAALLT